MNATKVFSNLCLLLLAGATSLRAQNGVWTTDASGNWSDTTQWLGGTVADGSGNTADFSTVNITADRTVTLDAAHTLSTLKFGDFGTLDHNWFLSGPNILTLGTTPTIDVVNQTATISSVIAGTAFTKTGFGTLVLNGGATNTFTGSLTNQSGALTVDFSNLAIPTNLIGSGASLALDGATLNINGAATGNSSQAFASTSFGTGENFVNVINNGTSASLSLGPLTYGKAAPAQFSTTGTITTPSAGGGPLGLMWVNYSTYGLADWASTSLTTGTAGTSPYTIKGLSTITGGYVTGLGGTTAAINFDMTANTTLGGNSGATTVRFNTPSATTLNVHGKWLVANALLVTPNMGAVNAMVSGGNWFAVYNTAAATEWVVQNNTAAFFINSGGLINDRGGAGALTYVQSGAGTVQEGTANAYTGPSYLNSGYTEITTDNGLGSATVGALVNLDGGTVVGNATFALDSNGAGANARPITLLGNGGGLAATAGNTLTVDGIVGSAAGAGPLTIGIPASAANGNVAGLLPGTGANTANTTPVYATGTVALTYPNGANGNFFNGGVIITAGATLSINSEYALGGGNYGGLTFNNGTLQYSTTLAAGAAGAALDISTAPVTFAGNGTIDCNGQTVTYNNSIGNDGVGSLTVANSGVAGVGALLLNGGSSYTGGTTVNSGATLGGTGTIAGDVTWTAGSYAALTQGSPLTVSGAVTLSNPTIKVNASGLTSGVYTLLTATGGIAGGSSVNSSPSGTGLFTGGYAGTVSISGNSVILTVNQSGVSAAWTDGLTDQNWSEAGNWSGGIPHSPGDVANFGVGGVGSPVNLDQNETVGGITFSNASSYIISGTNTLTLDNTSHSITITVTAGSTNAINTAVALNGAVLATVAPSTAIAFGGSIANESTAETLTVSGGGSVILAAANSYGPAAGTVGTTLNGTTLQLGNNAALAAGDVNVTANSTLQVGISSLDLANNIAVAATHTVTLDNNGDALTLSGVISGNGSVAATGVGTVSLSGANNSYSGGTTVNGGTVSITADGATAGSPANLGAVPTTVIPNNIVLNGGELLASATLTLNTNRGIGIDAATGLIDAANGQTLTIAGVIASESSAGTNNLTINSGTGHNGIVVLGGANTFNGTNAIGAGTEQLANPLALQNSILDYDNQGGLLDFGGLIAATLGGLTGTENLNLVNDSSIPVALTLGNNNTTTTYLGALGDGGNGASLTKTGSGVITIGSGATGGANYSGSTTVNDGTLILGGKTTLTTTGNLDVSGTAGPSSLILADSATATFGGIIELCYDGGAGYPAISSLTVKNNAILNAVNLSFGNASRLAGGTSVTVQDNGTLSVSGAFDLNDNIGTTAQNTALNLNGGMLAVGKFISSSGANGVHQSTINFNGGVLLANASDPSPSYFLPALAGLTVNLLTNGATINPNGNSITIAAALSGTGGLTNIGSGTLTLSGTNSYLGSTTVSNGVTLNVINTAGSATGTNTVLVNSGATLAGTGAIAGNVTWLPGALAIFNVGAAPTPLTVGVVTLNNNLVTVNVTGTPLSVGSYTLMNYTAAGSTGAFNSTPIFTGAGIANGLLSTITTSSGTVILTVTPNVTTAIWDVDSDGNWTDAINWSSTPTMPGSAGDAATLGFGSALRTVVLDANESIGYLSLTNDNSFVIANAGHTLTLDNNNAGAYLIVSGGTSNLIQTAVALNDNATVALSGGDSLTVSGTIANSTGGAKTLTINGTGKLTLTSANTYGPAVGSVGTILNGGILQVANSTALAAGDLTVAGNGSLLAGAADLVLTNNLLINSGATATLDDAGNILTLGGGISGGGTVLKIGGGTLNVTNNNSYDGALIVSNGTLVLSGANSGGTATITNNATLQLANANALNGNLLTLNNNSTLQLRADSDSTFSPVGLALQNSSDTLDFDVAPLSSATNHILTLNGTLAFASSSSQTINVSGSNTYTLALGAITLTSSTSHNPYYSLNINTVPNEASVIIAAVTSGNWGDYLNLAGGGNVTIAGNLSNTSDGSLDLFVNDGTTATLQGQTLKNATGDAYRYSVQNGTLIIDNSGALINDTTGAGFNSSYFILGAATNVYFANGAVPAAGVLVKTNNSYNAAVYLGDSNNPSGGLTVDSSVTNYVSDGDIGFVNGGVFTIGGQNTSGVNTFANPIILGWTLNQGKSVTLVAATGGEVDFTGNILANGTDQTAGITVGDVIHGGLVKLTGSNTFGGTTIIANGTLALANNGVTDASINNSSNIKISTGTVLDVSGQSNGTFPLGLGTKAQILQGAGTLNGILNVGSLGTVAPGSPTATGILTVNGNTTLGGNTWLKLNSGSSPTSDELLATNVTASGTLTVTNIGPPLVPGNSFQLFSTPVSGFSTVILPTGDNGYVYTWNNLLAVNGTIVVKTAAQAINTNAATVNFQATTAGNSLQFSWAADHLGWQLYTNATGLNAPNSWFPVPGSATVTNETITINPANPNVYFQLRFP
jgi:autotransporter-associated beta strand protein